MSTLSLLVTLSLALSCSASGLSSAPDVDVPTSLGDAAPWPTTGNLTTRAINSSGYQCDYTKRFATLEDLESYVSPPDVHIEITPSMLMPIDCSAYHALRTLINLMDNATANYTSVNDGYDDLFDIYKDYMRDSTPTVIVNGLMFNETTTGEGNTIYVDGPGMKYFDCTINGRTTACPDRETSASEVDMPIVFKLRDVNGFNGELANQGLSPDWLAYGDSSVADVYLERGTTSVITKHLKNFPIRNDSMVVPNPKDIVTPALQNFPSLRSDMANTANEILLQQWNDTSMAAPAQVYSVPVFVMMQGIDNMSQAKTAAEGIKDAEAKEAEEKKKNIILLVLSLVLIFVPVVGEEVATAAGLVTLARSIMILGALGNGALAIYDTVQDPQSAVVNVLGALFGLGGLAKVPRTEEGLSDLAVTWAKIKPETIQSFGKIFEDNDSRLRSVLICR